MIYEYACCSYYKNIYYIHVHYSSPEFFSIRVFLLHSLLQKY